MTKILWIDTETTGLIANHNEIVQLSSIIEVDGDLTEFNYNIQPLHFDRVEQGAVDTHGITINQMHTFPPQSGIYQEFVDLLDTFVDKYDKEDKFYLGGQNVNYDGEFIRHFFLNNDNLFWFSYIKPGFLELMSLVSLYEVSTGQVEFENYKLETLCKVLGVDIGKAHDSLYDVIATRECFIKLYGMLHE